MWFYQNLFLGLSQRRLFSFDPMSKFRTEREPNAMMSEKKKEINYFFFPKGLQEDRIVACSELHATKGHVPPSSEAVYHRLASVEMYATLVNTVRYRFLTDTRETRDRPSKKNKFISKSLNFFFSRFCSFVCHFTWINYLRVL